MGRRLYERDDPSRIAVTNWTESPADLDFQAVAMPICQSVDSAGENRLEEQRWLGSTSLDPDVKKRS